MSIDYSNFRAALVTWAKSTGLTDAQVIWARSDRATACIATLRDLENHSRRAPGIYESEYDFLLGTKKETGTSRVLVSVQVIEDVAKQGQSKHLEAASKLRNMLGRSSMRALFDTACASCFDRGQIIDATQYLETDFEPKAVLDLQFYVADVDTETLNPSITGTFIQRTTIDSTAPGYNGTLDISSS